MKIQRSIEIAAPPEKIWPFLVEPEKILQWCITFIKFEYTAEKRTGVGATFYLEEKAGGPLMKLNFKIIEWLKNEKIAFSGRVRGFQRESTKRAGNGGQETLSGCFRGYMRPGKWCK